MIPFASMDFAAVMAIGALTLSAVGAILGFFKGRGKDHAETNSLATRTTLEALEALGDDLKESRAETEALRRKLQTSNEEMDSLERRFYALKKDFGVMERKFAALQDHS